MELQLNKKILTSGKQLTGINPGRMVQEFSAKLFCEVPAYT
jgi:hypothetical protein